jgi:hypothetical protein
VTPPGCDIHPFAVPTGKSQVGCGKGNCPARVTCGAAVQPCPVGAVCTLTVRMTFDTPADRFTGPDPSLDLTPGKAPPTIAYSTNGAWEGSAIVGFDQHGSCDVGDVDVHPPWGLQGDPRGRTHCDAAPSVTFFGQNQPINTYCFTFAYKRWDLDAVPSASGASPDLLRPVDGDAGPDDQRRLHCQAEQVVKAAGEAETAAAGEHVFLYVFHFGIAKVPGEYYPPSVRRATVAKARHLFRAFKTIKKRITKPGPVELKPKLTTGAKRVLARTGRLRVRMPVTFTQASGAVTRQTTVVTLTRPIDRQAIFKQQARSCRKHRKAKRCRHR